MEKIGITIIGAGVIGLAVAEELANLKSDILIVEKNHSFGQETSSRNSEVIHAGIYYPKDSLKAKTCIEGKQLLYDFCEKNNIPHKRIGKLIVAINDKEIKDLENLYKKGIENGVTDLVFLTKNEIKKIEPNVNAQVAVYSPSTGIIDSHSLMKKLSLSFKNKKGEIVYNTDVIGINKTPEDFKLSVKDKSGETFSFLTEFLINAAGLNSYAIAKLAGVGNEEYKINYCKGDYFRVHNNKSKFISRLIYPVPKKDRGGLGIHATLDLGGSMRLGPDDEYITTLNYNIDENKKTLFYKSAKTFLPFIEQNDLKADTSGIRPKLQSKGEDFRDFIIKNEENNNLPQLINLIGIESPGLTACLSIAGMVKKIVKKLL